MLESYKHEISFIDFEEGPKIYQHLQSMIKNIPTSLIDKHTTELKFMIKKH